jgi:4a-hydroxytetrahydrobiopterin dehydratase
MERLQGKALEDALSQLPKWRADDGKLVRDYVFADFKAAMEFVNGVAHEAEAAGHHPDIDIRYNRVKLALETHDAGGLTTKDAGLARTLDLKFGR